MDMLDDLFLNVFINGLRVFFIVIRGVVRYLCLDYGINFIGVKN